MGLLVVSGGILLVPVFAFFTSFMFWPGALLRAYNWFGRFRLGLSVRYSHSGSYRFCYTSRGIQSSSSPSLLLLHGFSASKDMWLPVVKYLSSSYHVVCVDMPGHEGTSRTGAQDYSIQGQVDRIYQFVRSIGLDKQPFHLIGTSMGGCVAGVYAAKYPETLSGATLICPAGLVFPTDSEFIVKLRELESSSSLDQSIPLIPETPSQLEDMLTLCCFKPINLPKQFLRGLLDNRIPNNGFYKEVFMEIVGEKSRHSLQEHLHLIRTPLHVIWGVKDQVVDVSGASVLQSSLPSAQVDLLEDCGHSVCLERPRKAATLIMGFLTKQQTTDKKES